MLLGPIECLLHKATFPRLGNITNLPDTYKEIQIIRQSEEIEEYVPNEGCSANLGEEWVNTVRSLTKRKI